MTHRLSRAQFEALCAGAVGSDVMGVLRSGQYSRRRLLLSALVDAAADRPDAHGPLGSVEQAWQILATAEERAPGVVEDVVMSPAVGVWLVRVTKRLAGVNLDGPPLWVELGFLHSIAAAVAVRAKLPGALALPVVAGAVTLPTVGQLRFPAFVPVQRHQAGVEIDDCTPYRWFSAPVPPDPLRREELAAWRKDLDGARDVLTRWHPRFATELAAGLASLAPAGPGRVVGASASAAFGGVVVAAPDSPTELAATLVHELQHSKLNALLDLVVLHTDDEELAYAPWRDDPRPLTGLLHGIYAFTSTVEFWHTQRRHVLAQERRKADFSFAHRHTQVSAAIESLASHPALTGLGARFVESAALRLARCPTDDVPPGMTGAIGAIVEDHRASWRLWHTRPDAAYVREAVAAWQAGRAAPAPRSPSVIEPSRREQTPATRIRLLTAAIRAIEPGGVRDTDPPADVAFAAGHYDEALAAYTRRLANTPADGDAWVGLGLTLRRTGDHTTARVLLDSPEVVLAVREQLPEPEPVAFARWLATTEKQN